MNRNLPERIFLCGFMGAGKSTIGKKLARVLNLPFFDLDKYIEKQAGLSIPQIFDREKESGFRKHEKKALLDLICQSNGVIALGGGALQDQQITDHIKQNGLLIFIEASLPVLISRICTDENRPMLLDEYGDMKKNNIVEKDLQALYQQRLPFYKQAAICIHNAGDTSVPETVHQLLKKIRHHAAAH